VTMMTRKNGQVQQERSTIIRRLRKQVQQECSTIIRRSHSNLYLLSPFVIFVICLTSLVTFLVRHLPCLSFLSFVVCVVCCPPSLSSSLVCEDSDNDDNEEWASATGASY
jgi:hypothetical protein